jgi:predicted dehydrogenase
MTTSHPLRWAILGTGNIARQFATGLNSSPRQALVAVGSRTQASADTFAAAYKIKTVHPSYEAALRDPEVDAVYISLPNSLHYEWTLKALAAGKHVLCEKPFADNVAQAREMFAAAERAGKVLAEAFMYRSHPLTHAVRAAVAAGKIGQLKMIRTSFLYRAGSTTGNVRFDLGLAGGALMDIGCYCINFARLFAGAEPVAQDAYAHLHESGVDDDNAGILKFPNGILATFTSGMAARADNTADLLGTDGFIQIPIPWKPPIHDAVFHLTDATGTRTTTVVSADRDLYGMEADDFAASVLDGAPLRTPKADTLGNMACLDALRARIGLRFKTDC